MAGTIMIFNKQTVKAGELEICELKLLLLHPENSIPLLIFSFNVIT